MSVNSKNSIEHARRDTRATLAKAYNTAEGVVKINGHNTLEHELAKAIVCIELAKQGKQFITEAIFENGKRADVVCLDDYEAIEILHTEQEKNIINKSRDYPIYVRAMKSEDVIKAALKEIR